MASLYMLLLSMCIFLELILTRKTSSRVCYAENILFTSIFVALKDTYTIIILLIIILNIFECPSL